MANTSNEIIITVKTPNSKETITVDENVEIKDFKELIAAKFVACPDQLCLIFAGDFMQDSATLKEHNVKDGSIVLLVVESKLQSGPEQLPQPAPEFRQVSISMNQLGELDALGAGSNSYVNLPAPMQNDIISNLNLIRTVSDNPLVQRMMNDTNKSRSILTSNPEAKNLMKHNPEISHMLNNLDILRQTMELTRNPAMLQAFLRSPGRSMSNLESVPGGYGAVRQIYHDINEPERSMMNALLHDPQMAVNLINQNRLLANNSQMQKQIRKMMLQVLRQRQNPEALQMMSKARVLDVIIQIQQCMEELRTIEPCLLRDMGISPLPEDFTSGSSNTNTLSTDANATSLSALSLQANLIRCSEFMTRLKDGQRTRNKRQNEDVIMMPDKRFRRADRSEYASDHPEPRPTILTLHTKSADVYDDLFDYLTLGELCAIGRTCKHLQRVAGEYFQQNFLLTKIKFEKSETNYIEQRTSCGSLTNFAPYAQSIVIDGRDVNIFRHVTKIKFSNLKQIQFDNVTNFYEEQYLCLLEIDVLKKISTLKFDCRSPKFCNTLLNRILPSCISLKSLILLDADIMKPNGVWTRQYVPTLSHLELNENALPHNESGARTFLRINQHVKTLAIDSYALLNTVQCNDLKLDELQLITSCINEDACNRLIALNQNGHVKQFKATIRVFDQQTMESVEKIRCLTSLQMSCYNDFPNMSCFRNLKKLVIAYWKWLSLHAENLYPSLNNLEELYLYGNTILDVIPLARRLPNLRIIGVIGKPKTITKSHQIFNIKALNDERKRLKNACNLKIYLNDEAYRQIRWTSIDLFQEMVEVRRITNNKLLSI